MRLAEIDGKVLLRRHGVAVPRGVLLRSGDPVPADAAQWPGHVLKAQVLEGGRGKRGLVRRLAELASVAEARRRSRPRSAIAKRRCMLEEAVTIAQRDLRRGAHRRHAPGPRALGGAAGRRGRRNDEGAGAHPGRRGDGHPRCALSRAGETVRARSRGAARALLRAPAGDRPTRGFGAHGDQSARAHADATVSSPATRKSFATTVRTSGTIRRNSR